MIMKKSILLLMLSLCFCFANTSFAQKTVTTTKTSYQNVQARMPQVLVQPLVKPLIAEVKVIEDAKTKHTLYLTSQEVIDLGDNLESTHNYGIFKFAEAVGADMIVAATFDFHTSKKSEGEQGDFTLVIHGFPAKFTKWYTATPADYEWMRITGAEGANNPVIKSVK